MPEATRLTSIGYWAGPDTNGDWPDVADFVDPTWDRDERDFVVSYLAAGLVAQCYLGYSTCRLCGRTDNGDLDLTDGVFVWPSGLRHYVEDHHVRLPHRFVQHAETLTERLGTAARDLDWWRTVEADTPDAGNSPGAGPSRPDSDVATRTVIG